MPETLSTFPKYSKRPVLSYMPQYAVEIYFASKFLNLSLFHINFSLLFGRYEVIMQ